MYRDGEHEKIRAEFHSLREREAREVPGFRTVLVRAASRRVAVRSWLSPVLAVACAAILAVAAPLLLLDTGRDRTPEPSAESAPADEAPPAVAPAPVTQPIVATTPPAEPAAAPPAHQKRQLRAVRQPAQNRNRSAQDCADC